MLQPIKYTRGDLTLLDQTLLPKEFKWVDIKTVEDGWEAINSMRVRGAPAIAISGILCVAVVNYNQAASLKSKTPSDVCESICSQLDHLRSSRPTAVNLFNAIDRIQAELKKLLSNGKSSEELLDYLVNEAERMYHDDIAGNKKMGEFGRDRLLCGASNKEKINVLTHCNTGSLATAGYGTALGVIRALHQAGKLEHAYCTETRPYNQGSRLTALELTYDNIPTTLITDSMAGALMAQGKVDAIVVGADRIVANGDTANKIGTYALSVLAQYHQVKFYIAAPLETLDRNTLSGEKIEIEQRSARELLFVRDVQIAPDNVQVWNPAFDVTPSKLIEAIITDVGVIEKDSQSSVFNVPSYLDSHSSNK